MSGEALERLNSTEILEYPSYGKPGETESISSVLRTRKGMVINFANPENPYFDRITKYLKRGKCWLSGWKRGEKTVMTNLRIYRYKMIKSNL